MKTFRTLCVLLFLLESHVTLSCLIWIWIGVWATDHDVTGSLKTHPFRVYFTLIWRLGPWRASSSLVHPLQTLAIHCALPFLGNLRFLLVNCWKVKKNAANAFITANPFATGALAALYNYLTFFPANWKICAGFNCCVRFKKSSQKIIL